MKIRILIKLLGIIAMVVGGAMLFPLLWSAYYNFLIPEAERDSDFVSILISCGISFLVGLILYFAGQKASTEMLRREGLAVVSIGWLLVAALGALPFYLSGSVDNYVDAYFESMSGFTTTGSTILVDIEATPRGILMWRSFTQWLGGMGIVVLFVAILPFLRASGKQLLYNEVPGPRSETLSPRIRDTAITLWIFYSTFSVILAALLWIQGMSFFDAVCHACTTMSTGGFSPRGLSVGHYDSLSIEITIIIFMVIAGTGFGLYYRMIKGDWTAIFRDAEWRFYILILLVATTLIVLDLHFNGASPSLGHAVRVAGFQSVSITTTTGFGTEDFDHWPSLSRCVMVVLFFVGGCAGSTAGGVKVIRILVIIKNALHATEHAIRPHTVRAMRVGHTVVEPEVKHKILAFFTIIMGTMVLGTLTLAALGLEPISALTAVATTLNNIGPGLEAVGAAEPFTDVHPAGKILLSLFMVVGRLEVFAVVALFSPRLWRST